MSYVMPSAPPSKGFNAMLWVAQLFLAAVFIPAGLMKLSQPIGQLAAMIPWVGEVPVAFVRFIGCVDLAGGLGVVLPVLFRVKPKLTVLAAAGIVVLQVLAGAFHLWRGEASMLPLNLLLLGAAAFLAWGRGRKVP